MPTSAQEELRQRRNQRARFARARKAETWYGIQLRKIAAQIGSLSHIYDPSDLSSVGLLTEALKQYAKVIQPWARNTAWRMIADVANRDYNAWMEHGKEMGRSLREEITMAPTGQIMRDLLREQVTLITSLPLEAAMRVHEIALGGITEGRRASSMVAEIMASGEVTKSRATLIARTETSRTASALTESRAQFVGSEGYIWRTSRDQDVRPAIGTPNFAGLNTLEMGSHRKLEGTYHRWDQPPIAGTRGERAHPGCIYNCRCYPEPVLPALRSR